MALLFGWRHLRYKSTKTFSPVKLKKDSLARPSLNSSIVCYSQYFQCLGLSILGIIAIVGINSTTFDSNTTGTRV